MILVSLCVPGLLGLLISSASARTLRTRQAHRASAAALRDIYADIGVRVKMPLALHGSGLVMSAVAVPTAAAPCDDRRRR
jgi:hypothetical protein